MVGLVTPNGIQLSPLNAIFQLRPDFDATSSTLVQHALPIEIDDDEQESSLNKQSSSNSDDSTTTDEEVNELVTMKFWKPEGRLQRERKMRSYNYLERARNEERWIDFAYYSSNEPESIDLRKRWSLMDINENSRLPMRWRKTMPINDYFQLLLFDNQIQIQTSIEKEKPAIESTITVEQKPLIVPPTKPKKKKKNDLDKTTKKLSRKSKIKDFFIIKNIENLLGRSKSLKSTDSTSNAELSTTTTTGTPLSSVSLPTTIIKQDPETIQNELLSFMKRRFSYRPYFKLSEINIGRMKFFIKNSFSYFYIFSDKT